MVLLMFGFFSLAGVTVTKSIIETPRREQHPLWAANYLEMYWFGLVPREQNLSEPFAPRAFYHGISNTVLS